MTPDRALEMRTVALNAAVALHRRHSDHARQLDDRVLATADRFAAFLGGTVRLRLTAGPITDQETDAPTGATIPEGATVAQLHDNEKFTVTADTEDAKGFDTSEVIEWTFDNPDVAGLVVSADTKSVDVIAGIPGSGVLTATVPALGLSATLAVDVVAAGTATIELAVGDVGVQ